MDIMYKAQVNSPDSIVVVYSGHGQSGTKTLNKGDSFSAPNAFEVYYSKKGYVHVYRNTVWSGDYIIIILPDLYYLYFAASYGTSQLGTNGGVVSVRVTDKELANVPASISQGDAFKLRTNNATGEGACWFDSGKYVYIQEAHTASNRRAELTLRIYPYAKRFV